MRGTERARIVVVRSIRFALVLLLALALLPVYPAAAQESLFRDRFFSDTPSHQAYYFDILGTVGIVRGDNGLGGPARPSQPVTRAEFAVMVTRLLALDSDGLEQALADGRAASAAASAATLTFSDAADIPFWATEAVATCVTIGIINGFPDGRGGYEFRPWETVSGAEAVAMLLRATDNNQNITGGWPSGYIYRAFETGLLAASVTSGDWRFIEPVMPLSRAQTTYLIHNALYIGRDYTPGDGSDTGTFARRALGAGLGGYAVVADVDITARRLVTVDGLSYTLAAEVVASGVESRRDLLGRRIYWLRDARGRLAYLRLPAQEPPVVGALKELKPRIDGTAVEAVLLSDGRVITCAGNAIVELNGQRWPFDPATILPAAEVTAVLDRNEAVYVSIIQEDLPEGVIRSLTLRAPARAGDPATGEMRVSIAMGAADIRLVIDQDSELYLNGVPVGLADLREWDVVYAATEGAVPKRALRVYAYRERVTGKVVDLARQYTAAGFHWEVVLLGSDYVTRTTHSFSSFCEDQVSLDLIGSDFTVFLNRYGAISHFTVPGPAPGAPGTVKVLRTTDLPGRRLLTVDWLGQELTFDLPGPLAAPAAGAPVRLHLSDPGTVARFETVGPARYQATVTAVEPVNGRISLKRDSLSWSLSVRTVPIYLVDSPDQQDTVGAYVELSSLAVGQTIWLDDPGAPRLILVTAP